uniref:Uncharacterized protein n=1 Tax=Arundo donax TaxID=35708 RepID=A0A0A8Y624_ARUDO
MISMLCELTGILTASDDSILYAPTMWQKLVYQMDM